MQRILICLFIVTGFLNPLKSQTLSKTILFEERVFNFGTIEESKGAVSHSFFFTNIGNTAMTVTDVQSSCGCIGKVVTQSTVKPGAKGKVTITFDPGYKSGFFSKEIIVFSNGGKEFNRIWVEGNIIPAEHPVTDEYPYNFGNGLYLRLKVLAFGYMKPGETKQMELHYANNTNEELALRFLTEGMKAGLVFTNPGKLGAKQKGVLRISYRMPFNMNEDVFFRLIPYVNHKKLSEVVEVKILNENKRAKTIVPKLRQ
jgi:hypothetical protein